MKTRTELFHSCSQAAQFARVFRDANPTVLRDELRKLHQQCEREIEVKSQGLRVTCNCPCHTKRSPYEIYETLFGKYDPDKPAEVIYSVWFGEQKAEYITSHPDAKKHMIDGNFFESELQKFFEWLDAKHR